MLSYEINNKQLLNPLVALPFLLLMSVLLCVDAIMSALFVVCCAETQLALLLCYCGCATDNVEDIT